MQFRITVYHKYLCFRNFFTIFLHDQFLNLSSRLRIDRVCYISVLPFCILPAWHSNEYTFFTFNDLDVMHSNSLSIVIDTTAFIFPSLSTFRILTSVIFILLFPCVFVFLHSRAVRILKLSHQCRSPPVCRTRRST